MFGNLPTNQHFFDCRWLEEIQSDTLMCSAGLPAITDGLKLSLGGQSLQSDLFVTLKLLTEHSGETRGILS